MNALTIVLYSLGQWSEYAGHPNESLARKSVYSRPVTGCKSGVRARIYTASNKPNTIDLLLSAAGLVRMLNFVSGGLLTYF